jgi:hypothetical protein
LEPRLTRCPGSFAQMRLSGLESSCPMTAPWPQTLMFLFRPSTKSGAIGLAGVAPSTSPEGPQARQIPSPRVPHGLFLLLALPPPRWALRLPSTPGRSTLHQKVPAGAARRGGAPEKSRCHTMTRRHRRLYPHPHPPPRPSRRGIPRWGDPRDSIGSGAYSTPHARGPF